MLRLSEIWDTYYLLANLCIIYTTKTLVKIMKFGCGNYCN